MSRTQYVLGWSDRIAMDEFSLADLTELTKSKRRSVQLWAEAGVIQAEHSTDRAGTGTHRRFSRDEATLACLIAGLTRHFHLPIGVLLQVSDSIRRTAALRMMFDIAVKKRRPCYLVVQPANIEDDQRFRVSTVSGVDEENAAQALAKTLIGAGSAVAVLRINGHLAALSET
ncbi:hypothetical protein ACG873_30220 [Mesorhizobium sp. AaZ16]|uniref:hypothetical protein n=1 Tax=Mesorhizobium sp. AaZ16 TaxID=3402289 RepID=UPI00374F3552